MKDVELYARVRYAVRIEGLSERAAVRDGSAEGGQDDAVLDAAGLPAHAAAGEAEAGRLYCLIPHRPRLAVAQLLALLSAQLGFARGLVDAVDLLDQHQAFEREPGTGADRLRLQRLVELAPRLRETADMHHAITLAYDPSRSGRVAWRLTQDFKGHLQSSGYEAVAAARTSTAPSAASRRHSPSRS